MLMPRHSQHRALNHQGASAQWAVEHWSVIRMARSKWLTGTLQPCKGSFLRSIYVPATRKVRHNKRTTLESGVFTLHSLFSGGCKSKMGLIASRVNGVPT